MPYRSWESLKIDEECIRDWASSLSPRTARNYVYYFLRYLDWVKEGGHWQSAQEMLDDCMKLPMDERYRHLDVLLKYIRQIRTGVNDRRIRFQAVRNFYDFHRVPLPRPSKADIARCFRLSETDKRRAIDTKPLEVDEVRKIILNSPHPYKAIFMVIFQSAMGLSEFEQFNTISWKKAVKELDGDGPVRIDLVREKVSTGTIRRYYTFIGEDAKTLIKEWLGMRPDVKTDALFVTYNKNRKEWVPVSGRLVSNMITKVAKKIGLITPNGLNRYHIHMHEFRDLFKSLCTLNGVNQVASEFFLGHTIDKLGYDKSPQYDEGWFRQEYMKVEPMLNVLSNPEGRRKTEEEIKKEAVLEAIRSLASAFGIDPMRVRIEKQRETGKELTIEEEMELLQYEIKKLREPAINNSGKVYTSKIVTEDELTDYVDEGWEVVKELNSGKFLVRKINLG